MPQTGTVTVPDVSRPMLWLIINYFVGLHRSRQTKAGAGACRLIAGRYLVPTGVNPNYAGG
jgi:hypothetical protein